MKETLTPIFVFFESSSERWNTLVNSAANEFTVYQLENIEWTAHYWGMEPTRCHRNKIDHNDMLLPLYIYIYISCKYKCLWSPGDGMLFMDNEGCPLWNCHRTSSAIKLMWSDLQWYLHSLKYTKIKIPAFQPLWICTPYCITHCLLLSR